MIAPVSASTTTPNDTRRFGFGGAELFEVSSVVRSGWNVAPCRACAAAVTLSSCERATCIKPVSTVIFKRGASSYLLCLALLLADHLLCSRIDVLLRPLLVCALKVRPKSVLLVCGDCVNIIIAYEESRSAPFSTMKSTSSSASWPSSSAWNSARAAPMLHNRHRILLSAASQAVCMYPRWYAPVARRAPLRPASHQGIFLHAVFVSGESMDLKLRFWCLAFKSWAPRVSACVCTILRWAIASKKGERPACEFNTRKQRSPSPEQRASQRALTRHTMPRKPKFIPGPSRLSLILKDLQRAPRPLLNSVTNLKLTLAFRNDHFGAR